MTKHMSEIKKELDGGVEKKVEVDIDFEADVEELGDDATVEDLKKQIGTLSAQKKHFRTKYEEATKPVEKVEKKEVVVGAKAENTDLSQADLITVIGAGIPQEDLPSVMKYAKSEGISIAEALNSDVVTAILDTNKEKRTVADATNTGKTNKSKGAITDEQLLSDSKKGTLPESDEDMDRLAKLRLGKK